MRLAVAVLLLAHAAAAQEEAPPDAPTLLARMHAAYAALDTLRLRGREEYGVGLASEGSGTVFSRELETVCLFRLWFDRERGFRVEGRQRDKLVATGAGAFEFGHVGLWTTSRGVRAWSIDGLDATFEDPAEAIERVDEEFGPTTRVYLFALLDLSSPQEYVPLAEDEPSFASVGPLEPMDGVPCWCVHYFGKTMFGHWSFDVRLWIDPATYLLRGWETVEKGGVTMRTLVHLENEPGVPISQQDLDFEPPASSHPFEWSAEEGWDFGEDVQMTVLGAPRWLPWALLSGGLALAAGLLVVMRRRTARR